MGMKARGGRIRVKRAHDEPARTDGRRFLVDRMWPRGIAKDALALEDWRKDAAPSNELRRWFGHDPDKFDEFRERYERELDERPDAWAPLADAARAGTITLVYGARDPKHNQAVVLRDYLRARL